MARKLKINGGEVSYKLTTEDTEAIRDHRNEDLFTIWFNDIKTKVFNLGDVLICYKLERDWNVYKPVRTLETYPDSKVAVRYLVIHIDDLGAPWVKEITLEGKVDNKNDPLCLWSNEGYGDEFDMYEVDPVSVDAALLDQVYDIKSSLQEENRRRKDIAAINEKFGIRINNFKEANAFIKTLEKGQTIYLRDFEEELTDNFIQFNFEKKRKVNIDYFKSVRKNARQLSRLKKLQINSNHAYYILVQ